MKNIKNQLLIVLAFLGTSFQMIKADGFFHSVGNVATLGELDRSEKRHADEEKQKKSKKNKKQTKSTSKKQTRKNKRD